MYPVKVQGPWYDLQGVKDSAFIHSLLTTQQLLGPG